MGEKIIVGPMNGGLRNDVVPFAIDNDSFPMLINAYQWRGRIKRKRGTSFLGRLTRFFNSLSISYNSGSTTITLDGTGNGNILTGFSLQTNSSLVAGSVIIVGSTGPVTYTDPTKDGFLTPTGTSGPNTINYATGAILIPAQAGATVSVSFLYYPDLPVMGLEDLILEVNQFPGTLAFDTKYSYNISKVFPYSIYDVSFYKNPSASGALPGYVPKTNETPTTWNGQDYQQFWTVNYQGALWATNGINIPFSPTNVGMQFAPQGTITYTSNTATTLVVVITNCPLVIGDFVFVNEWTGANAINLNFQTGYVTACSPNTPPLATKTLTITFPFATIGIGPYAPGIIQYLTNRSDITNDCLRFYDGDPTNGNATNPSLTGVNGWVNFAPPLNDFMLFPNFSIADLPPAQYYLVGARMILPFKDRLLFIGPVIQTASAGSQKYLQDTVIYSQNGTPYYTASFTGDPTLATTPFNPILVPVNQTGSPVSYLEDVTGFGGFITAGLDKPITTASANEDVLIMGLDNNAQVKLVYSGDDYLPFNFFIINFELGSSSTFSIVNMDKGVITRGNRGLIITSQTEARRIDLDIPNEVFQMRLENNGTERITAQRDYLNEWIYMTYPANNIRYRFPGQTLQYNYRDDSWAILRESYTTYGSFRKQTGFTWATVGLVYPTWKSWNEPWSSGSSTLLQPEVIAGNQQGFVVVRDDGTNESNSLYIQNISGNTVTSTDHCLNNGDYIIISGALGTVGAQVNNKIFSISGATTTTFVLNPPIAGGTYLGLGLIKRMYVPRIQSKQFPTSWSMARKTRLGTQQYLLTTTDNSQITLLIYLSQNASSSYNEGNIVPQNNVVNNSLIYSTVLYTCPESANLGLTPANTNLQMISEINSTGTNASSPQSQIWHRVNTSLIGDTVQVGFTLSDAQMRAVDINGKPISQFSEIELHGFILDTNPSQVLA